MNKDGRSTPLENLTGSSHSQVNVIAERCKGCGFCIEFCPQHILYQSTEINSKGYHIVSIANSDECTGCNTCSMLCPEFAISVVSIEEEAEKKAGVVHV